MLIGFWRESVSGQVIERKLISNFILKILDSHKSFTLHLKYKLEGRKTSMPKIAIERRKTTDKVIGFKEPVGFSIKEEAKSRGTTPSKLIRLALFEYIANNQTQIPQA